MRREFVQSFGSVCNVKSYVLREAYKRLTGDATTPEDSTEKGISKRISEALDMFDPELLVDLRVNNAGRPEQYEVFLEECQKYISEEVETAVDDRRHDAADVNGDIVTHLAAFLSVRDLYDQVAKRIPEGTPLPSEQWLRLQFWPRRKNAAVSRFFTGKIKLKFMVQARQLRKFHEDAHYASALFKYEKAFACKYKDFTTFVCMDDKHACKVGEPKCPVAAV